MVVGRVAYAVSRSLNNYGTIYMARAPSPDLEAGGVVDTETISVESIYLFDDDEPNERRICWFFRIPKRDPVVCIFIFILLVSAIAGAYSLYGDIQTPSPRPCGFINPPSIPCIQNPKHHHDGILCYGIGKLWEIPEVDEFEGRTAFTTQHKEVFGCIMMPKGNGSHVEDYWWCQEAQCKRHGGEWCESIHGVCEVPPQ